MYNFFLKYYSKYYIKYKMKFYKKKIDDIDVKILPLLQDDAMISVQ